MPICHRNSICMGTNSPTKRPLHRFQFATKTTSFWVPTSPKWSLLDANLPLKYLVIVWIPIHHRNVLLLGANLPSKQPSNCAASCLSFSQTELMAIVAKSFSRTLKKGRHARITQFQATLFNINFISYVVEISFLDAMASLVSRPQKLQRMSFYKNANNFSSSHVFLNFFIEFLEFFLKKNTISNHPSRPQL